MLKAILGKKVGMTQIFKLKDGAMIPVTVVEAGPCVVTQVKTVESDGYEAVQVCFWRCAGIPAHQPAAGQFKKSWPRGQEVPARIPHGGRIQGRRRDQGRCV